MIDEGADRQLRQQRVQTTDVVDVVVGHEQVVNFGDSERCGSRCDAIGARRSRRTRCCSGHPARTAYARRPRGIDQQRLAFRRNEEDGRAAFDVHHHNPQVFRSGDGSCTQGYRNQCKRRQ